MGQWTDEVVDRHGRRVSRGTIVFHEGDPADSMYVIRHGRMRILKKVGAENICLAILGPGDFFGEMGPVGDAPRSATAVADSDSLVVSVPRQALNSILQDNPELGGRLLGHLCDRLRESDERLVHAISRDEPTRFAEMLYDLARQGLAQADAKLWLAEEVDEVWLAGRAGVLPSAAERVMDQLEEAGLFGQGDNGRFWVSCLADLEIFIEYCELKRRYDPLGMEELAALSGLSLADVHALSARVTAKRLRVVEDTGWGAVCKAPQQRYAELKTRFELGGGFGSGEKGKHDRQM